MGVVQLISQSSFNGFRIGFLEPGRLPYYAPDETIDEEMALLSLTVVHHVEIEGDLYGVSRVLNDLFRRYKSREYWYNCPLDIAIQGLNSAAALSKAVHVLDDRLHAFDISAIENLSAEIGRFPDVLLPSITSWVAGLENDCVDQAVPILRFLASIQNLDNSGIANSLLNNAKHTPSRKLMLMAVEQGCDLNDAMSFCSRHGWRPLMMPIYKVGQSREWNFDFSGAVKIAEKNRDDETLKLLDSMGARRSVRVQRIDVGLGISDPEWKDICREYGPDSWLSAEEQ
jgi:hypothetical protein